MRIPWYLSRSWKFHIHSLKEWRKPPKRINNSIMASQHQYIQAVLPQHLLWLVLLPQSLQFVVSYIYFPLNFTCSCLPLLYVSFLNSRVLYTWLPTPLHLPSYFLAMPDINPFPYIIQITVPWRWRQLAPPNACISNYQSVRCQTHENCIYCVRCLFDESYIQKETTHWFSFMYATYQKY